MKKVLLLLFAFYMSHSYAQDTTIYIHISSDTIFNGVQDHDTVVIPVFTDTNINNITDKYTFKVFKKAYPKSELEYLRRKYRFTCNNTYVAEELKTNFPDIFLDYTVELPTVSLSTRYTPNDWGDGSGLIYAWALDHIRAREAWGLGIPGCKGSSSTIIGINDTYFDLDNPDLSSQVVYVDDNTFDVGLPLSDKGHGTIVAGQAAAATDNGVGYPGVGFNCKMRVSTDRSDAGAHNMTETPYRPKVINLSWRYGGAGSTTLDLDEYADARIVYNEIYERGIVTCAGAGNGKEYVSGVWGGTPRSNLVYPASYNNVISTTNVMGEDCPWLFLGGGADVYCGEHNRDHADTSNSPGHYGHQHNTMVDICAPAFRVGGLTYNEDSAIGNPFRYYCHDCAWGTSFASPQTAGVVGLMASVNPCLTPYQLEWALKVSANDDIYSKADNAYVSTPRRLGAGRLDAEAAVRKAFELTCNDPATQTFYVAGLDINTLCAPGFSSNGAKPILSVVLKNGTPPYTYHWSSVAGNTTTLNTYTSGSPTVTASDSYMPFVSYFLTVTDNSAIQKVASKLFRFYLLTDNTYELISRDGYMDMAAEPNGMEWINSRDWNYWESPDVWNRLANDAGTEPQNVEYFSGGAPNYINVRVRNMGCANYTTDQLAYVKGYWTHAGTGEHWAADWTTADVSLLVGGTIPLGREITPIGTDIPNLAPGNSVVFSMPWYPVNPLVYPGAGTISNICALARIIEPLKGNLGITFDEVTHTTENIKNNNNIATRNMASVNLGRKSPPHVFDISKIKISRVFMSNPLDVAGTSTIQVLTDKDINLHFAGNPSEYMYVSARLEDGLWTKWEDGGYQGAYATMDEENKTVTYDPSTPLRLENISLDTNERFYIDFSFQLRDNVPINIPISEKMFYVRQLTSSGDTVLGSVSFRLDVTQDDTVTRKGVLAVTELSEGPSSGCQYAELVVANCGVNMAEQVDVRGWLVNDNSGLLTGSSCDEYNVNRGHFRLAYDDMWARVPVGSTIMLYNYANNCYNLPDTFSHDSTNARYWIPIGASSDLHVEQYDALENSDSCAYCSDTGATVYSLPHNWNPMRLNAVFDAIEVICPGCTRDEPQASLYFAAGHFPETYSENWEVPAIGESNVGITLISNPDSSYGFKYNFTGNTEQELLDPSKWTVSSANPAGSRPASLGGVSTAFKTAIVNHELNFPCCGSQEDAEERQAAPHRTTKTVTSIEHVRVYPNPANTLVHFEFPMSASADIRIMDITGKVVETQTLHNAGKATFDVKQYAPGLYLYEVSSKGKKEIGKVVIGVK